MEIDSQTNNWFSLIVPGLIAGLAGLLVQAVTVLILFRKLENHKNSLSRDLKLYDHGLNRQLEEYKKTLERDLTEQTTVLQSEVQTRLHEFQTRFSAFHERRTNAIELLYEAVSKVETDIEEWLVFDERSLAVSKDEFFQIMKSDQEYLTKFHDHKRIYWSPELISMVMDFVYLVSGIIPRRNNFDPSIPNIRTSASEGIKSSVNASARKIGGECERILRGQ